MAQLPRKVNLHVVFDTNVIWSDSILEVFNNATITLIRKHSGHQDLSIQWTLPRIARQEREYQMRRKALECIPSVQKLEALVGFNWGVDKARIADALKKRIDEELSSLGVREYAIDPAEADWELIMANSANRVAPFEHKDGGEKGFRDALICETLRQILASINKGDHLLFVSSDAILQNAALASIASNGHTKARCVRSIDDLTTEINVLVSKIPDEFAQRLVEHGAKFFFDEQAETGLYVSANVRSMIDKTFASDIAKLAEGISDWSESVSVAKPIFRQKIRQRVHFTSTVTLTFQGREFEKERSIYYFSPENDSAIGQLLADNPEKLKTEARLFHNLRAFFNDKLPPRTSEDRNVWHFDLFPRRRISVDVNWSVSVNNKEKLGRAKIDSISLSSQV